MWGGVGLDGRPRPVPLAHILGKHDDSPTAGDHQGPPTHPSSLSSVGFLEKLLVKQPVKPMGKMSVCAFLQRLARPINPKTLHLKDPSSTLAPTAPPASRLTSRLSLMHIG